MCGKRFPFCRTGKVQDNKYVAMIACIYLLFCIALHSDMSTLVTSTTSGETQCTICKRLHHQETGIHGRRPMARCSCFSLLWCSLLFQFAVVLSSCFSLLRCFLLFQIPVPAPALPSLSLTPVASYLYICVCIGVRSTTARRTSVVDTPWFL